MTVTTIYGDMDESLLEKRVGPGFVEYRLKGELVHRSAAVDIEQRFPMFGVTNQLGADHVPADGKTFMKYGFTWKIG